jgi:tetratricopeptide (TPR) repeat protein
MNILYAQTNENLPDILVKENEYLASFPKTAFVFELNSSDFIVCRENPLFKPKKEIQPTINIEFQNRNYIEIGKFNNDLIEYYLTTNDIKTTNQKFLEGYNQDPLFFAFLYNLGRLYYIQKNYEKSIFYFNKALYFFPNYARIHYYLGKNHFLLNNEISGEYHFRKAIQLNPEQVEYWIDFINILYDKKQFFKADLYISRGQERFSDNNYFKIFRIRYLIKKNQYKEAINLVQTINLNQLSELEQLELKYTKFLLYEKTTSLENALTEINEILNANNRYFLNKYPKELLLNQKMRLEKMIKK